MLLLGQPQQRSAHEGPLRKVEGPHGFFVDQPLSFFLCIGAFAQICDRQIQGQVCRDNLDRAILNIGKTCPQDFVPANDFVETALQCAGVESATHSERPGYVVERIVRFQLVEEPKPLL